MFIHTGNQSGTVHVDSNLIPLDVRCSYREWGRDKRQPVSIVCIVYVCYGDPGQAGNRTRTIKTNMCGSSQGVNNVNHHIARSHFNNKAKWSEVAGPGHLSVWNVFVCARVAIFLHRLDGDGFICVHTMVWRYQTNRVDEIKIVLLNYVWFGSANRSEGNTKWIVVCNQWSGLTRSHTHTLSPRNHLPKQKKKKRHPESIQD